MARSGAVALVFLSVAAACAGCASDTLPKAASLAKAGQAASAQMERNVILSDARFVQFKDALAFSRGFDRNPISPGDEFYLRGVVKVRGILEAYGTMLERLSGAYAAMGELAGYDAGGSLDDAVTRLCGSAGDLAKAVGGSALPGDDCAAAGSAAGAVATEVQARQVAAASARIAAVLGGVIGTLKAAQPLIVGESQLIEGSLLSAANSAYAGGAYSCAPVLDDIGAPLGLKTAGGTEAAMARNGNLRAACRSVLAGRGRDTIDAIAVSYQRSLDGLARLQEQHRRLAAGTRLDLAGVLAVVDELQTQAAKIQPAKGK